ncbi:MAG: hypothetical protein ACFB20_00575 [Opitutales bacterium]
MNQPLFIECANGTWIINRKPAGAITEDEHAILRDTLADNPGDISVNIRGRVFELLRLEDLPGGEPAPAPSEKTLNPEEAAGTPSRATPNPFAVTPIPFEEEVHGTRTAVNRLLDRILAHLQDDEDPAQVNPVIAQKRKLVIESLVLDLQGAIEALQAYIKTPRRDT